MSTTAPAPGTDLAAADVEELSARYGFGARIFQPRRPAFYALFGCLLAGIALYAKIFASPLLAHRAIAVPALALFGLYGALFFWYIRAVDVFDAEPARLVVVALAWGGLAAGAFSVVANGALFGILAAVASPRVAADWGAAFAAPLAEEPLKLAGLVLIALVAPRLIGSTLDGMVVGALIGLGFQVSEDVVYAINGYLAAGSTSPLADLSQTFFDRGLIGGLASHALYTAIAGAGVGYYLTETGVPRSRRLAFAAGCFLLAFALHAAWNSPLASRLLADHRAVGRVLQVVLAVVLLALLLKLARRKEAKWVRRSLGDVYGSDLLRAEEFDALRTPTGRRDARRAAAKEGGRRAARLTHDLQRAQARLGQACVRSRLGEPGLYAALRQRIIALRAELAEVGPAGDRAAPSPDGEGPP